MRKRNSFEVFFQTKERKEKALLGILFCPSRFNWRKHTHTRQNRDKKRYSLFFTFCFALGSQKFLSKCFISLCRYFYFRHHFIQYTLYLSVYLSHSICVSLFIYFSPKIGFRLALFIGFFPPGICMARQEQCCQMDIFAHCCKNFHFIFYFY